MVGWTYWVRLRFSVLDHAAFKRCRGIEDVSHVSIAKLTQRLLPL